MTMAIKRLFLGIMNLITCFIEDVSLGMAKARLFIDDDKKSKENPSMGAYEYAQHYYHIDDSVLRAWKREKPGPKRLANMAEVIDGVETDKELTRFSIVVLVKCMKLRASKDPTFLLCFCVSAAMPLVLFLTAFKPSIYLYLITFALAPLSLRAMQNINMFHPCIAVERGLLDKIVDMIGLASLIYLIILVLN